MKRGGFYINLPDSDIFIVLSKFYVRHLLIKITEPQRVSTKESQNYNICLYLHAQFVYIVRSTRLHSSVPLLEPGTPRFLVVYKNE